MLTFVRASPAAASAASEGMLWLSFEKRCVSRQRVRLENGVEAGLVLPRGTVLRDGDILESEEGRTALVRASLEELSLALCPDPLSTARVAYHLGNRHACVMLGEGAVRYLADHVLDQLVAGLGITVRRVREPFQPEAGAYGFTPADAMISLLSVPPALRRPETVPGESPTPGTPRREPQ